MNRLRLLALTMLYSVTPAIIFAQQTLPPAAPFLNKAPTYSAWTVTYVKTKVAAADLVSDTSPATYKRILKEVQISKMDKTRRELRLWSNGQVSEVWYIASYSLSEQPGFKDIFILSANHFSSSGPAVPNFSESDFPELKWLSLISYVGEAMFNGQKCYYFRMNESSRIGQVTQKNATGKQAWINQETKLPQAYFDGTILRTYVFQSGEINRPSIPERFTKALQAYQSKDDQSGHLMKVN